MRLRNSPEQILKGLNEVVANLNKEIEKIKDGSMKGLIESAIVIRRDMDTNQPSIPVDLGNLRQSWFVVTAKSRPAGTSPNFKDERKGPGGKLVAKTKVGTVAEMHKTHIAKLEEAQAQCAAVSRPVLIMGFTANYAMWVHEMIGSVNWNRTTPQSGAKFFEYAIKRNQDKIIGIIKKNAQI